MADAPATPESTPESNSNGKTSRGPLNPLDYGSESIEVQVTGMTFCVPKAILCRTSEFFQAAVKKEWQGDEGRQKIILDDETAETFGLYVLWLHTGTIDAATGDSRRWTGLCSAYVLGEKIIDTYYKRNILSIMIRRLKSSRFPTIYHVDSIFQGTSDPSPARHLMLDVCLFRQNNNLENVEDPVKELHEDLLRDLLKTLMASRWHLSRDLPWDESEAKYLIRLNKKGP